MTDASAKQIAPVAQHTPERVGDWHIYFEPPPIPCRNSDWHFYHDDYDGAPDANDMRAGHAESYEGCLREIAEIEGWLDAAEMIRAIAKATGGAA